MLLSDLMFDFAFVIATGTVLAIGDDDDDNGEDEEVEVVFFEVEFLESVDPFVRVSN